jgi:DNA polymerase-3 subunit epsilon
MTGITNAMVEAAPSFHEVAPQIYNLLKNRVFVAHNVNFDFSFVKHHLKEAGFDLQTPKLCTIRLSRKVFPGFPKYGLGIYADNSILKLKIGIGLGEMPRQLLKF